MHYNIDNFAKLFVKERWRVRFIHEFNKKPHELMHRCITNWGDIFIKDALHATMPQGVIHDLVRVIDWGDIIKEMEWHKFVTEYPKVHAGFIAVSKTGNFGFLETHPARPQDSKHYYLYAADLITTKVK